MKLLEELTMFHWAFICWVDRCAMWMGETLICYCLQPAVETRLLATLRQTKKVGHFKPSLEIESLFTGPGLRPMGAGGHQLLQSLAKYNM